MKKTFTIFLAICCLLACLGCRTEKQAALTVTGWDLQSRDNQQIADGVACLQLDFQDSNGMPHIVYCLTVDPKKATLHKGTSKNQLSILPTERQNVLEHLQSSVSDGLDAVAAVNGDFFAISSSFIPSGLSVKNGIVLRENTNFRPFCAITKSGDYIVRDGKTEKVDLSSLEMATGGSHVLVKNGAIPDIEDDSSLSTVSHPRTLSGVCEDGTILLVVIDGRQPKHSNGATLAQCAELMRSLGAIHAINHDGGGSSTMITRKGDQYTVVNSPSDGNLRDVFCFIQVVLK